MFVHSRCFPDQVIFNRHLADVHVISGLNTFFLHQNEFFYMASKIIWFINVYKCF